MPSLFQKLMAIKWKILLILAFAGAGMSLASRDVSSVSFRGDCANYGMRIEDSYFDKGAFLIVTTGARFEYVPGELKIYQELQDKRLLATIEISGSPEFEKVEASEDHILLWSESLTIGIYGDSTCIVAPKAKLELKCTGNFKPDYEGRHKGELLLIDDSGGIEIYPQRHEAGYDLKMIQLGRKDWVVDYLLNASEQVMIAAFPPRKFNFQQSCSNRIVHTGGIHIKASDTSMGFLPPDNVIEAWSKYTNIICIHGSGLYPGKKNWGKSSYNWFRDRGPGKWCFGGPYNPVKPSELHRVVVTAHKLGMKVVVYSSPFYYYKSNDQDAFFEDVQKIYNDYNLDGIYVDSLYYDKRYRGGGILDDKIANWELMRRLRKLVGPECILYYGSGDRTEVGVMPNIDALCDFVINGEAVKFTDFNDAYIQYQVRKFRISNTIGMIKASRRPADMSDEYVLDKMLSMNGRARWVAYPSLGSHGKYTWPTTPPSYLRRYYQKLNDLRDKN